jgi:hypothetical protein
MHKRIGLTLGTSSALAATAAALLCGCGGTATTYPEEEQYLAEQAFRRLPGSAPTIFAEAKKVLTSLGFMVTGERQNAAIAAKKDVGKKHVPIFVWLTITAGDKVSLRFYNLDDDQEREWTSKLFRGIKEALIGTPAEREKRGRPKRG